MNNLAAGGHRDAVELLSQKLHHLFVDMGAEGGPEFMYDMDLLTMHCEQIAGEDLSTYMTSEFGQGYLMCVILYVIEELAKQAEIDELENAERGQN